MSDFVRDPVLEERVCAVWRENGLRESSLRVYLRWVRRFSCDSGRAGMPDRGLTRVEVEQFAKSYAADRSIKSGCKAQHSGAVVAAIW